jgi:O-antigen ligase
MNPYSVALAALLLFCGCVDSIRRFGVGSISLLGVITIITGVGSVVLLVARAKIPKAALSVGWLVAFLCLGVLSLYINQSTSLIPFASGAQNLLVYIAFVGVILLSAVDSYCSEYLPWYISEGMARSTQIAASIFGVSLLLGGLGSEVLMGPRSFALFVLVGLSWYLAQWRYKLPGGAIWSIILACMVTASFSRTVTFVMLVLFPLSRIAPRSIRGWLKMMVWTSLIILIAYLTFTFVEPVRNRFTDRGDSGSLGGLQVNTSGRDKIWQAVQNSIAQAPWIGKGPGSVSIPVSAVNKTAGSHPHNDYLRLTHDYGYLGVGLWVLGYAGLLRRTWRNWLWADVYDRSAAPIHLAATLGLVGVALAMLTDNVVVYVFTMAPLGILVGASIGIGSMRRQLRARLNAFVPEPYLSATEPALSPGTTSLEGS